MCISVCLMSLTPLYSIDDKWFFHIFEVLWTFASRYPLHNARLETLLKLIYEFEYILTIMSFCHERFEVFMIHEFTKTVFCIIAAVKFDMVTCSVSIVRASHWNFQLLMKYNMCLDLPYWPADGGVQYCHLYHVSTLAM